MCNVRNEYYMLMEKFISIYHISYGQAKAAVRETANYLFGRKEFGERKSYDPNVPVENNTLPERKIVRKNSKLF